MKQNRVIVCQKHANKNRHNSNNRFTYIKKYCLSAHKNSVSEHPNFKIF